MNLLQETIEILTANGKTEKDVLWIGSLELKTTWENFKQVANIDYDSGYGHQVIAEDLLIVGADWWMERHEYDGSEWWEFKQHPKEPEKNIDIKRITGSYSCLSELNKVK
jgi:hypothetical protein